MSEQEAFCEDLYLKYNHYIYLLVDSLGA